MSNTTTVLLSNIGAGKDSRAFTFGDPNGNNGELEVLIGTPRDDPPAFTVWEMTKVAADRYTFRNLGTDGMLVVNENDHLVTRQGVKATEFAVESAGGDNSVIKLPNANEVAESYYDKTSMEYTRVKLAHADGSAYQHWQVIPRRRTGSPPLMTGTPRTGSPSLPAGSATFTVR